MTKRIVEMIAEMILGIVAEISKEESPCEKYIKEELGLSNPLDEQVVSFVKLD